jgi:hypothetical protein
LKDDDQISQERQQKRSRGHLVVGRATKPPAATCVLAKNLMSGRPLRFAAAAVLVVGLISAVWIYLVAAPSTADTLGYDPAQSKQYLRAMELYGGKANVLAAELRAWFDGTRLAYAVACASVLLAGAFWLAAAASDD